MLAGLANLFGHLLVGRKDKARRLRALAAQQRGLRLVLEHGLKWFADPEVIAGGGDARLSACAELGLLLRAGWPDTEVIAVARALATRRPSVTVALSHLRSLRRGASARADDSWVILARALERTLNTHLARHPTISWDAAARALDFVAAECRDADSGAQ